MERASLLEADVHSIVCGNIGETGTLQGAVYFKNGKTTSAAKKALGSKRYHLERTKGNWKQNVDYCTKDNDIQKGDGPRQGSRLDLQDAMWTATPGCSYCRGRSAPGQTRSGGGHGRHTVL